MWTKYIESIIFSRIKQEGLEALATSFPNIYYTTSEETPTESKFPTVYVHEVPGTEQGEDLEGTEINAMLTTIQVDVTDNINKERVKTVMDEVLKTMKSMRFQVVVSVEIKKIDGVYKGTARYRRLIAQGDIY